MGKKVFLATIWLLFLFASLLAGTRTANITKANPIPNEQISPPPIVIQSPLNTTYDQNDIPLNFTVVGASEYFPMTYKLSYIYYVCDGEFHDYSVGMNLDRDQYCTNLTGLSKGQHTLSLYAEGVGSYYISSSQWTQYTVESVQTVTFTVNKDPPSTPSPSPTPTLAPPSSRPDLIPSPSPTPSSSPSPTITVSPTIAPSEAPTQQPTLTPVFTGSNVIADPMVNYTPALIALSTIIVMMVLGVAAYIYFGKRRTNSNQTSWQ
jgi:hypothetical protein